MALSGFRLDVKIRTPGGPPLEGLSPRRMARAERNAVNDTARQATTMAARLVAKEAGLPVGKVKPQFRTFMARESLPQARIKVTGRAISLLHFGARQTKKGVTARAWGERKLYAHTFIAQVRKGQASEHQAVFVREGKARLPLHKLYGPGIPGTLLSIWATAKVEEYVAERLDINMARQIDRALRAQRGLAG